MIIYNAANAERQSLFLPESQLFRKHEKIDSFEGDPKKKWLKKELDEDTFASLD